MSLKIYPRPIRPFGGRREIRVPVRAIVISQVSCTTEVRFEKDDK